MSNSNSLVFKEMQLCALTNEGAVDQPHRKAELLCCKQKAEENPPTVGAHRLCAASSSVLLRLEKLMLSY